MEILVLFFPQNSMASVTNRHQSSRQLKSVQTHWTIAERWGVHIKDQSSHMTTLQWCCARTNHILFALWFHICQTTWLRRPSLHCYWNCWSLDIIRHLSSQKEDNGRTSSHNWWDPRALHWCTAWIYWGSVLTTICNNNLIYLNRQLLNNCAN